MVYDDNDICCHYRVDRINVNGVYYKNIMEKKDLSKKCAKCEKIKNISEFGVDSTKKTGYRNRCKQCLREIRAIRRKNPLAPRSAPVYSKDELLSSVNEKKFVDYLPEKIKWKITVQLLSLKKNAISKGNN